MAVKFLFAAVICHELARKSQIEVFKMMGKYRHTLGNRTYQFTNLADLMAKATPSRSGDRLAGVIAHSAEERVVAQMTLADLPLKTFLNDLLIPYEEDESSRLIIDDHDAAAFAPIAHFTVGDFRNWLLRDNATTEMLQAVCAGLTPEMVAAVSKLMRNQDLILVAKKCRVITAFRNTIGLAGRLSTRLQPNHPTDDVTGIAASILDGLLYGSGDAVIGINPATDNVAQSVKLMRLMDDVIRKYEIPTQSCVLTHVTNTLEAIERGAPVDLVFQSIGGTEATNSSFGFNLKVLAEAEDAEGLVVEFRAEELALGPLAAAEAVVGLGDRPRRREGHRDGVLGGRADVALGGVRHDDAVLGCGLEVDVVDADAGPADDGEVRRRLEDRLGHLCPGPDDQGVDV
jgi:ethanolamine ammonia-lyase large subunit